MTFGIFVFFLLGTITVLVLLERRAARKQRIALLRQESEETAVMVAEAEARLAKLRVAEEKKRRA